ncbi:flagellar biosynthetic protein FliO [Curtobacterium sp. RRHDQ10]|uniref:FliO/MopB family protein n=1 Tax=Curtobacterium phyllosphaerae TaxID=3413379 RepID=UPI003BF2C8B3
MDTLVVALRVALSLGVVLALLWVLQRKLSKGALGGNGARARRAATVTVVARQGIGGKASVVVVDVEGERLVLGVTESQVNVLSSGETPAPTLELVTSIAPESTVPTPTGTIVLPSAATAAPHDPFSAVLAAQDQPAPRLPAGIADPAAAQPLPMRPRDRGRRAAAPTARVLPTAQQLQGSILSADTWKQAAAAVRARRAG